jgi:hypothetical protein
MKVFVIGKSDCKETLQDSEVQNLKVLAEREGQQLVTYFEGYPERTVKFTFQESTGRVCIEFQLQANEFLAIGDKSESQS